MTDERLVMALSLDMAAEREAGRVCWPNHASLYRRAARRLRAAMNADAAQAAALLSVAPQERDGVPGVTVGGEWVEASE